MDVEFLIPISLFGAIFGMFYVYYKTRHQERMALIEKGANASLFEFNNGTKNLTLKIGLLLIGLALGILIGSFIDEYTVLDEQAYFSMIFLFGGIGLLVSDFVEKKREKK